MEIKKTITLNEKDSKAIFETLRIFENIVYELEEDVSLTFIDNQSKEVVSYTYQDELDRIISLLGCALETRMVITIS